MPFVIISPNGDPMYDTNNPEYRRRICRYPSKKQAQADLTDILCGRKDKGYTVQEMSVTRIAKHQKEYS